MPLTNFPCSPGWSTMSASTMSASSLPPSPTPTLIMRPKTMTGSSSVESLPSLAKAARLPVPFTPSLDFEAARSELMGQRRLENTARQRQAAASLKLDAKRTLGIISDRTEDVREFERRRQGAYNEAADKREDERTRALALAEYHRSEQMARRRQRQETHAQTQKQRAGRFQKAVEQRAEEMQKAAQKRDEARKARVDKKHQLDREFFKAIDDDAQLRDYEYQYKMNLRAEEFKKQQKIMEAAKAANAEKTRQCQLKLMQDTTADLRARMAEREEELRVFKEAEERRQTEVLRQASEEWERLGERRQMIKDTRDKQIEGLHDRLTVKGTKSQKRLVALEEKKAKQAEEREKQRRKREEMLAVQRENLERARVLKEGLMEDAVDAANTRDEIRRGAMDQRKKAACGGQLAASNLRDQMSRAQMMANGPWGSDRAEEELEKELTLTMVDARLAALQAAEKAREEVAKVAAQTERERRAVKQAMHDAAGRVADNWKQQRSIFGVGDADSVMLGLLAKTQSSYDGRWP